MSCSTCTQYWYPCSQNSLFPQLSCQEFWMSCGDDLGRTSEMGWRETGFLLDSGFSGGENCCPGRRSCAESQLHTPLLTPPPSTDGKGQSGGSSNFAWHTNPSQMVMLKITHNSNVELHRPSEKTDDLKQFMLRSKGIFKMWRNCHSENIFDRSTFCWFGERVSPVTVSNVNTIHTKPTRLSISCGPLWNWPYFYVLCPQGAINNNTIKLNKYIPMKVKVSRKNVGIQGSLSTEQNIHLVTKKSRILAQYCKCTILEVWNKFADFGTFSFLSH